MKDLSKEMALIAFEAMEEKKAEDVKAIDISDITVIADYFIIGSGIAAPQVEAITDEVQHRLSKAGYQPKRVEGNRNSSWVLLDYGDIVVHVFSKEDRLFYDLERIWRDGVFVNKEELKEI